MKMSQVRILYGPPIKSRKGLFILISNAPVSTRYTFCMQTLILSALAFPVLMVLDFIWIGTVASSFYKNHLGGLMRQDILYGPAIAFYIIYAIAIAVLVLTPALQSHSVWKALGLGALLGLAAFAAYDCTNWATVVQWPWIVSIVDMAWGTFTTAVSSAVVYLIVTKSFGW